MAVEDEIWRPGYSGPAPVSGETVFAHEEAPDDACQADDRRTWQLVATLAALGAVSLTAFGVVGSLPTGLDPQGVVAVFPPLEVIDDDRLQFSTSRGADFSDGEPLRLLETPTTPFAGADVGRLPTGLAPLWTTELAQLVADGGQSATTWIEVVDSRYVVVGTGDARALTGPAAIHLLDASTGERVWRMQLDSRIDNVEVVAAIDDVLVLTIGTGVLAFDLATGAELWDGGLAKVGGSVEGIGQLAGTDLLAVTSPDRDDAVRLIEPRSGAGAGEMVGEVIGTDGQGRWHVLRGDKLFEFDLSGRDGADPTDRKWVPTVAGELVGALDSERSRAVAVIGGSIVTTVDEMLAVGPLAAGGERIVGTGMTPLNIYPGTPAWLVLVRGIVPLGGSAFATVGGGTVSGAEVIKGSIRFAWQRRGTVTTSFATERGVVLLLGTDGGSAQTLIDGATGETIAPLTMSPGLFDALDVVGNGFLTRRTSRDGPRIAGLDLDGNELWALEGSAPVSVGDRIVVRSTPQPDGSFEVTAFGDDR